MTIDPIERKTWDRWGRVLDNIIYSAFPLFHLTLTSTIEDRSEAQQAWRRFRTRVDRRWPGWRFIGLTAHVSGSEAGWHFHILLTGPTPGWTPNYSTIRAMADGAGLGRVMEVNRVTDTVADRAAVVNYLLGHFGERADQHDPRPSGAHRFNHSAGFGAEQEGWITQNHFCTPLTSDDPSDDAA